MKIHLMYPQSLKRLSASLGKQEKGHGFWSQTGAGLVPDRLLLSL